MKTLNIIIKSCSECPYSYYAEHNDVGVDFGMSYYCDKGADHVGVDHIKSKYKPRERRAMTEEENKTMIRKDCPL